MYIYSTQQNLVRITITISYTSNFLHLYLYLQPGLKILEALAASGLRSIRYALEIPRVETVVANDLSKDAYHSICRNIEHNQVGERVKPSWREARYCHVQYMQTVVVGYYVWQLEIN